MRGLDFRRFAPVLALSATSLLSGCSGDASGSNRPGPAANLTVASGSEQQGEVGTELPQPVVVKITDADGRAVPNQQVNFVVVQGQGTVFAGSGQTNTSGEVRERWTLGPAVGEQILEARAVDASTGAALVFGRISATAKPGPAASLEIPDQRLVFFADSQFVVSKIVTALDRFGNPATVPTLTVAVTRPDLTPLPPELAFTVSGDAIQAPDERDGWLTVSSGSITAPKHPPVFAMFDLRRQTWSADFECRRDKSTILPTDSTWAFSLRSTGVQYQRESGRLTNRLVISFTGTVTVRDGGGSVVEQKEYNREQEIEQWMGFITFQGTKGPVSGFSDGNLPRSYTGQPMCLASENLLRKSGTQMTLRGS